MTYFSTFSGIGGFELGIGNKGECIGYSEIDKYAIQIYEKHFKHKNYGDITKIDATELPDFDCFVGGFPCQAFSVAGKRRGFEDTRGTLFFDIARILAEKRPRNLVLENVKGLLSHDEGKTFQTILGVLADLGYFVEWQVLNSKNFGVPQNRERVFIVGHLGGEPRRKVFPIQRENGKTIKSGEVVGTLQAGYAKGDRTGGYVIKEEQGIRQINQPKHSNNRVYADDGISPTLNTMQGGDRQPKIAIPVLNGRRFKENDDPSFTLTGQDKHGVVVSNTITATHYKGLNAIGRQGIIENLRIRKLTPTECERLQGFPDGWTDCVSDTQRYKCLGNAVTVNVIRAIFERL